MRHIDHTQKSEISVIPTMTLLGMRFRSSNPGLCDFIHSRDTHKRTLDYKFPQILTLQCANEKTEDFISLERIHEEHTGRQSEALLEVFVGWGPS